MQDRSSAEVAPNLSSDPQAASFSRHRWFALGVFLLAYVLSAIDARIITLLAVPLKKHFALNDTQLGALQGFALAVFYAIAAIPIGRLVDRSPRRARIAAIAVVFWSAMTTLGGLAKTFTQLFLARIGVGVGEAGLSPTAHSLIADFFEPRRRALAAAIFQVGYPLGGGLALILGGALLGHFTKGGIPGWLSGVAEQPWQATLIVVGLPGIFIAALLMLVKEPPRRGVTHAAGDAPRWSDAFRFIARHARLYTALFGVISLVAMLAVGSALWFPSFFSRTYAMPVEKVGLWYGTVTLVFGVVGTILGGWLAGRVMERGSGTANLTVVGWTTALKAIPLAVAPLMPSAELALVAIAIATLIGQGAQGAMIAAFHDVTPNQYRGQVVALALFFVSFVGSGIGGVIIGAMSQHLFTGSDGLRYALAILPVAICPAVIALIFWGLRDFRAAQVIDHG